MSAVRDYFRVVAADPAGAADADLLARFAATRDEAAFELLVWRHAALVRRACRAVLRDHHAAEDAAQAAFLVLARKAGTFAGRGTVVGWLYRVARRAAVRLAKQRRRLPGSLPHPDRLPADDAAAPAESAEAAARLWAEVDRLPERYRVPVLLCHFEGLTHPEAARRTGWPVGTVAGRLSRARALLARRLTPKGVPLAVGVLGPPAGGFVGGTARAAVLFAGRQPVPSVSPVALSLAEGVTRTMTLFPLKLAAAAVLLVSGLSAGVWAAGTGPVPDSLADEVVAARAPGDDDPAPPKRARAEKAAAPKPADAATRMRAVNSLKQILLAIHNYHDVNSRFPADITDKAGKPLLSWRVAILPYIEQDNLYKQFKLDEPWDSEHNKPLSQTVVKLYQVPGQAAGDTKTYFQGLAGPGTMFERGKRINFAAVTDGLSNTLAVVAGGPAVEWAKPADLPFDPENPKAPTSAFANVLVVGMGDGSVSMLGTKIDPDVFRRLAVRNDGEVIDFDSIPRPDLRALTKEDRALAEELVGRVKALRAEAEKLAAEREKLLAERRAAPGMNLDALMNEARQLTHLVEQLKAEVERLRAGDDPTPPPAPPKKAIKK